MGAPHNVAEGRVISAVSGIGIFTTMETESIDLRKEVREMKFMSAENYATYVAEYSSWKQSN